MSSSLTQRPTQTSPKHVQVSPKKEPTTTKASHRISNISRSKSAPSEFSEPIAAKMMQIKIRQYLKRKKFLIITLADVQSEIADLNELEEGFTSFFIFIIFLICYFWCLSIQMNPTLDYQMSQSLKHTMESPRFGPQLEKTFAEVKNIDDAILYLESLYLSTYRGTENEHECAACRYLNDLSERAYGLGAVDMCGEITTNPKFNVTTLPEFCKLMDLGFCVQNECFSIEPLKSSSPDDKNKTFEYKNKFDEIVLGSSEVYAPIKSEMNVNEFRKVTQERCSWETPWVFPFANKYGGYTTRVAKSFGGIQYWFPDQKPNYNEVQIVDCNLTMVGLEECQGLGFTNCVEATKDAYCSDSDINIDTNCSFFNHLEDALCNDDVTNPNDFPLPIQCGEGEVLNCRLNTCVQDTRGDNNCDLHLNCWNAQWDLGDCEGVPLYSADHTCDCTGVCFDEATCISYGAASCEELFWWFTNNGECERLAPLTDGITTDCSFYNYDNGECGSNPSLTAVVPFTSKASYINTVLLSWLGFLETPDPNNCEEAHDCLGECLDLEEFLMLYGDGICHPRLNCKEYQYDAGDCNALVPDEAEIGCDGIADCHGTCISSADCASFSATCADLLGYFLADGVCQTPETDGFSFDCFKFDFDDYACETGAGGRRLQAAISAGGSGFGASGFEVAPEPHGRGKLQESNGDDDDDNAMNMKMHWGTNSLDRELLEGGWIGNSRSVGGAILIQYRINKRENCESKHIDDAVFRKCIVDDEIFKDQVNIDNRYETDFASGFHNDVIDTGRWNVGLKQMFCGIEKTRLFWAAGDQYKDLWVSEMTINLPVYNGNVNGGMFALGTVHFKFDKTGGVETEFDARSYKLFGLMDFDDPDTGLRVRLELIVTVFFVVLLYRAIRSLQATGLHLQNFLTILSSIVFLFIILIWSLIAWNSLHWELREADPLGGDESYENAIKMISEQVEIKGIYDLYGEVNILFCVLALVRCFIILSFHKRLSILTETLWEGLVDIYHWAAVLAIFTTIFATVFFHLFGAEAEQFSTWFKSFKSLLLLVVGLGDWGLEDVGNTTIGWFLLLLYGAIVTILMINLSLGIVLDAYNIHSKEREEADTLPHSLTVYFYRKLNRRKHWLQRCFKWRSGGDKIHASDDGGDDAALTLGKDRGGGKFQFKRRETGEALQSYMRMSKAFNERQMKQIPIPIKNAKDVLRDEYLSEEMICKILRELVVKKMISGGIEQKQKKETRIGKSRAGLKQKRKKL
ncbi:hypothetical protein TrST_g6222 [Triparma strigata]|uniref:Polycystin cation channel PKD1/PKD2 domain-containing protein n=1 Tax=Triparma strigata TaxID=1606541 RepID=A0A9W7BA64_9STRA|nr:hypothetical protein TrST_g6222 [Triparma strigata]